MLSFWFVYRKAAARINRRRLSKVSSCAVSLLGAPKICLIHYKMSNGKFLILFELVVDYVSVFGKNALNRSMGSGKMVVELFSADISLMVCKYLSCNAMG